LQAIALIIKTLHGAKGFSVDNYDTLVTQAARHGSRLLKKPHQATAVHLASHLWWQSATETELVRDTQSKDKEVDGADQIKAVSFASETSQLTGLLIYLFSQYPHWDSKRVLECLQKSLRIANSAIEEIVTVQLYCDALDQYLYYLDHNASAVCYIPPLSYVFLMSFFLGDPQVCQQSCRIDYIKHRQHIIA
jgi:vacuolar protein sorting-associated protein 35